MKGMSIVISTIFAIVLLSIGFVIIHKIIRYMDKEKTLSSFENLAEIVQQICMQEKESKKSIRFRVTNDIEAVFSYENKSADMNNIYSKIEKKEKTDGKFLCIKIKTEKYPRCLEAKCNIDMIPFNYTENDKASIWLRVNELLGKGNTYTLSLVINKTGPKDVYIENSFQ